MLAARPDGTTSQRGSAVADFALVSVVLVPMFFAILQVALIWHTRTTLTAAASDGAHRGAAYDATVADGERRTSELIHDSYGTRIAAQVSGASALDDGERVITVTVRAKVPTLAFWGPSITVETQGHAVKEVLP